VMTDVGQNPTNGSKLPRHPPFRASNAWKSPMSLHQIASFHTPPTTAQMSSPAPSRSNSHNPVSLTSSRNNPISLRIYKAIGTTFDDPSSRQALEIASSYYADTKGKSKAVGEDDEDDILGSNGVGGMKRSLVGRENTAAMARKGLKRDVEARLAGGSQKFLEAFGEVDKVGSIFCTQLCLS
jgi:hypothetical protein